MRDCCWCNKRRTLLTTSVVRDSVVSKFECTDVYVKCAKHNKLVYETKSGIQIFEDASYRRGADAQSATSYAVMLHGAAVARGFKLQSSSACSINCN